MLCDRPLARLGLLCAYRALRCGLESRGPAAGLEVKSLWYCWAADRVSGDWCCCARSDSGGWQMLQCCCSQEAPLYALCPTHIHSSSDGSTWKLVRPGHIADLAHGGAKVAEGVLCVDAHLNCVALRLQVLAAQVWGLQDSTCLIDQRCVKVTVAILPSSLAAACNARHAAALILPRCHGQLHRCFADACSSSNCGSQQPWPP